MAQRRTRSSEKSCVSSSTEDLKSISPRLETIQKSEPNISSDKQNISAETKEISHVTASESWKKDADEFQKVLSESGFGARENPPQIKTFRPRAERSFNLLHFFQQNYFGLKSRMELHKSVQCPVVSSLSEMTLYKTLSPFDRRVTALEWHPVNPNILAVGSKGGDIILWNVNHKKHDKFIQGGGAGGSCQALKFWPWDSSHVVTASVDGTVTLYDFEGRSNQILADTMNSQDLWYCSVAVNTPLDLVAAGDNTGFLRLMHKTGEIVFNLQLHKGKITHTEFSPREDWLLCTASLDHTVQLWDVRMIKDRSSSLAILKHEKAVNSAYFSSIDGCRLLTTDQYQELRVYKSPNWLLDKTFFHPHRIFQHITPIKATWHPLYDLIVVGRYPDPYLCATDPRSIDIMDVVTGEIVCQLQDSEAPGIICLNKFNRLGDYLASGMGVNILLWNRNFEEAAKLQEELMTKGKSQSLTPGVGAQRNLERKLHKSQKGKMTLKTKKLKVKDKTAINKR
ncbi:hypothetical protein ACJMK2_007344 [Sinanodonta woodiana]|uniref:DNA damage-binding protein 2 n=1 Tax=Sinanodonta woodiana TaxID=1069815 RepID=A0ABD3VKT0_SINWO